jgi:hypothetical protein
MDPKPPPSLREFDYFSDADAHPPVIIDGGFEEADEAAQSAHRAARSARRRAITTFVVGLTFLAASVWFLWGYREAAAYAFLPADTQPLELGDVRDMTPAQVPHNRYVRLHGITEHRGLRQEAPRGLSLDRREYWYFRLLGSRGVFVEVDPDPNRFGFTQEITVTGRAVDPRRAPMYAELLRAYADIFATENRAELRVIQNGVVPGEGKAAYIVALALIALLTGANVFAFVRAARAWRRPYAP